MELFFTFFSEFLFADGFDYLHAVYINAKVAFHGSLCLRFRCRQNSRNRVRVFGHCVNICRRTANVDGHNITDAVIKQFRAFHNRARCRDNRPIYHVAHMLHARCLRDIVLKRVLDDLSARLYIQRVNLRINIINKIESLSAFLIKNQFHLFLILNVSGINYRCVQTHVSYHFRVIYRSVSFAVINAARNQDEVRVNFLNLCEVASSQSSDCNVMNDSSRAKRRFSCSLRSHIIYQSVHRHLQTTRGR